MSLVIIIVFIALGLIFIFVEIFLIPGTAFVGVLGAILAIAGVVLAYAQLGTAAGNIALAVSSVGFLAMLFTGFKRISEMKWGLKENIQSRVNVLEEDLVKVGDEGIAFSDLRPGGKALINDLRLEVYSTGEFISKDAKIAVTKVTSNKIYVKPIKA